MTNSKNDCPLSKYIHAFDKSKHDIFTNQWERLSPDKPAGASSGPPYWMSYTEWRNYVYLQVNINLQCFLRQEVDNLFAVYLYLNVDGYI